MICNNETAFVFDLDKTIGYFTQISMFIDGIEEFIERKLKRKEFFKLLDLYPEIFRPEIFSTFNYLLRLKKNNKCVKILIYTNNIGPKSWVHDIRKYIEHKLHYRLFDRTIAAWKVRGIIYEKCRSTHNKTPKDLIKCGKLNKNCKIVFFDDQIHRDMFNNNIFYRPLDGYRRDILFENMITIFLNSKLAHIIKKNKLKYFKSFILKIVRYSSSGFRYVEKPYKSKIHPKNNILKTIKNYVKKHHFRKLTKKKRRRRRKGTRKI